MNKLKNILNIWLPFAVTITAFCALTYAAVQQSYRQNANDPQIQMAEDAAFALDHGKVIKDVVPGEVIDTDQSLAPFYLIFNSSQQPVAGSGSLNNSLQTVPNGVLDFAKKSGENRVTWEPQPGTRIATVIIPYKEGYVLVGRNLRKVEVREDQLTTFAEITWALALIATFVVIAFGGYFLSEKK
jgi:hypothetical protein